MDDTARAVHRLEPKRRLRAGRHLSWIRGRSSEPRYGNENSWGKDERRLCLATFFHLWGQERETDIAIIQERRT